MAKFTPYRDSKGRIRNAEKITPENQERLYRGDALEIKPVFTKVFHVKKTRLENGKKRVRIEKQIRYVDNSGKFASEADFRRYNYFKSLRPDAGDIYNKTERFNFAILDTAINAAIRGNTIKYRGEVYQPKKVLSLVRLLRKVIIEGGSREEYPIFEVREYPEGRIEISEIGTSKDLEGEELNSDEE